MARYFSLKIGLLVFVLKNYSIAFSNDRDCKSASARYFKIEKMKIYRDNIKVYDAKLLKLSKLLNRISFLRLFIFVISSTIFITLFYNKLFTPFFVVFPLSILCFASTIKYHNKTAFLKKHTAFLKDINESEILPR